MFCHFKHTSKFLIFIWSQLPLTTDLTATWTLVSFSFSICNRNRNSHFLAAMIDSRKAM